MLASEVAKSERTRWNTKTRYGEVSRFSLTHRDTRITVNGANRVLRKDERRAVVRQLAASSLTGGVASIQENTRPMVAANLVRKAGLFRSTALVAVGDGIAA